MVGGRSVGTPAIPKLMETIHQRYGVLPWGKLFDMPIHLAKQGFEVSPRLAISVEQNWQHLARYPKTAAYFLPNGVPLQAGSLLKNLEFADSVQALAAQGAKALHTGKYAQNIVSVVQNAKDNPGQLSLQDLSDYQVVERLPVCVTYRIFDLLPLLNKRIPNIATGCFLIQRDWLMQTNYTRLTFSPKASPASPAVNMFLAALTSRSWVVLHSGQSQWRVSRLKKGKVYPQLQQRLELGKNWSILTKLLPAQLALYSNCWISLPQLASAICLASLGFLIMFFTCSVSTQITWLSLINLQDNLCKLSNRQSKILFIIAPYLFFETSAAFKIIIVILLTLDSISHRQYPHCCHQSFH